MATVEFTPNLKRHLDCPEGKFGGASVGEVLDEVFAVCPRARSYVLDDGGAVRKHVAIFVNGEMLVDRKRLTDEVSDVDKIFVMQALSGG